MSKEAHTDHPVHELIRQRWSPRAFTAQKVSQETLNSLLEAARWAASSYNAQPWRFIVATQDQPAEFERLLSCLVPFNQGWAKHAPVLMLTVARLNFAPGKPNLHAAHDVGQAAANMAIQAAALGLQIHQMAGFDPDAARRAFNIPADFAPVAAIAAGYAGNPDSLPADLRQGEVAPRQRKPISELVFSGTWA